MMKFDVEIKQIEIYYIADIEAENPEEAKYLAEKKMEGDKNKYHHDSDCEVYAF